jgi:hypothetical protein
MLPKLQQSNLANTLRRDNLASQIQCNPLITKARTNSREYSASRIINHINHGKTNMHPIIHTAPSETSPKSISPKKNLKMSSTNPFTNLHSQGHLLNIAKVKELEGEPQAL